MMAIGKQAGHLGEEREQGTNLYVALSRRMVVSRND